MVTVACWLLLTVGADARPIDTIVVAPPEFVPTLEPWLAYRHAQGHRFVHIGKIGSAEDLRGQIRRVAEKHPVKTIVLVGDADHSYGRDERLKARTVPTHLAKATVNVKFGSEVELATDNYFADLDDDQIPDVAVGRLPADSAEELSLFIRKSLAYEKLATHGAWRQKVNIIAGVGGFGALVDSVVEMSTKQFLTAGIPASYTTSMTYGSWRSPYSPDPRLFHAVTRQRLEEGCLFWVYIGHGQTRELDRVIVPGAALPIFKAEDSAKLRPQPHWPIALFLACYTGAFDQPKDCLAEELLRSEGGPVAILAGSRVTMPYGMAVMGTEMLQETFQKRPATLGELVLKTKREMMKPPVEAEEGKLDNRQMLDALAAAISPAADQLTEERLEHVQLFNLLGDPLLRLAQPLPMTVRIDGEPKPGQPLRIAGTADLAGRCTLELVTRRDGLRFKPEGRDRFDPTEPALRKMHDTYLAANDPRWAHVAFQHSGGDFAQDLVIPADCRGACHIRAFIEGTDGHAVGAVDLTVRPPRKDEPAK